MLKRRIFLSLIILAACALGTAVRVLGGGGNWTLIAWNNLGMHCMDSDYSVFSILPPYNVVNAQLIDANGHLVQNPSGVTVTYEAVTDPAGSINTTSVNKTNFWEYVADLFGVSVPPDTGLAGESMPGSGNTPQSTSFDSAYNIFVAEGIPLTPYDDKGRKNFYPMMHLVARNSSGAILAATDIVLPVSDEMDCRACHASDASPEAQPSSGWVYDANPERDYRLNILLLHDQKNGSSPAYASALSAAGYNAQGLYANVTADSKPVLCARCHGSNALPGTGIAGVEPLTQAVHSRHAQVTDPTNGETLNSSANRTACYRCHPGSETRCLRGAMGSFVAPDGSLAIQCQNCHGSISEVGAAGREGWLNEPQCQQCHTGTATLNSGQIRFTTAFVSPGNPRTAASSVFATNPSQPAAGFSLYRFSRGHGGVECSACHGATHAVYKTVEQNDNIQSLQLQGHVGTVSDCTACHLSSPITVTGGPHGMHPVGAAWANGHGDVAEHGASQCQACHGLDYRGTVLSEALGDRNLSTRFGVKQFWRGFQIGCYTCHNGPSSEHANSNRAPVVSSASAKARSGSSVVIPLIASDPDGNTLKLRIVSQPDHGTVALAGTTATYNAPSGFAGSDSFTFAASDGSTDSNLGVVSLNVAATFFVPFYQAGPDSYTGFAVSNFSSGSANLEFTAYGIDGHPLPFPQNPSHATVPPQGQLAKLGSEIFSVDASTPQSGWVEIAGDTSELGCIFQFGGNNQLDGSIALTQSGKQFRFTRVFEGSGAFRGQPAVTYLSIANPTDKPVTLTLNLLGPQPDVALAPLQTRTIPSKGFLYGTVSEIFGQNLSVSSGYIDGQVLAGDGVVGFELIRFPGAQSVVGLNAVSGGTVNQTYSAQLAANDQYFTDLKLINTSTMARSITLRAVTESGSDIAPPVSVNLAVGEALERDVVQLFGFPAGGQAIGSLSVAADGPGVIGDVLFGHPAGLKFAAATPLQGTGFSQAVFNHVANGNNYFTGLALFNPNMQAAAITLDVYSDQGTKTGSTSVTLDPGKRFSRLLTELVPASAGQMRGFFYMRSTQPLIGQELFGDMGMTFLSAVPPTAVK